MRSYLGFYLFHQPTTNLPTAEKCSTSFWKFENSYSLQIRSFMYLYHNGGQISTSLQVIRTVWYINFLKAEKRLKRDWAGDSVSLTQVLKTSCQQRTTGYVVIAKLTNFFSPTAFGLSHEANNSNPQSTAMRNDVEMRGVAEETEVELT